jgi:hypothetical protein
VPFLKLRPRPERKPLGPRCGGLSEHAGCEKGDNFHKRMSREMFGQMDR